MVVSSANESRAGADTTDVLGADTKGQRWVCPRCDYAEDLTLEGQRASSSSAIRQRDGLRRCPVDDLALVRADVMEMADGDPYLGTTIADRFVVLDKLGAGSMGTVYRARQQSMNRDVAVKILRSDRALDALAKARFTREAQAMSLLTSPHTVRVFDFGEIEAPDVDIFGSKTVLYLAMELLEGESLGQRLKRVKRLGVEQAIQVARQTLLSLAEAHNKGIIHRDLKPDNVFLTKPPLNGQAEVCKVLDFGIAKVMGGDRPVDSLETQAGTVFGTPRYMSPEQAQGKPLDARSDLYSLGVLLYQMLAGRPPFADEDAVVVMARHIRSIPVPPIAAAPDAKISKALSALVQRVLSKNPEDRPETATELLEELDRTVSEPWDEENSASSKSSQEDEPQKPGPFLSDEEDASGFSSQDRPVGRHGVLLATGIALLTLLCVVIIWVKVGTRVLPQKARTVTLEAVGRLQPDVKEPATVASSATTGLASVPSVSASLSSKPKSQTAAPPVYQKWQ